MKKNRGGGKEQRLLGLVVATAPKDVWRATRMKAGDDLDLLGAKQAEVDRVGKPTQQCSMNLGSNKWKGAREPLDQIQRMLQGVNELLAETGSLLLVPRSGTADVLCGFGAEAEDQSPSPRPSRARSSSHDT